MSSNCQEERTYQFLNRQVARPITFDLMLDSGSLVGGWLIFANFYIRSTRSFFAIGGFMSENLKNEHVFSKHCSSANFHPTGLKFWPMRDFILGQNFYFLMHGQKMSFWCGFFHFRENLSFKKAFTKNPISRVWATNFKFWQMRDLYMGQKNVLRLWAKKCNLHADFFISI